MTKEIKIKLPDNDYETLKAKCRENYTLKEIKEYGGIEAIAADMCKDVIIVDLEDWSKNTRVVGKGLKP